MFSFQDPNLTINVDVWTELQQRSSSPQGDITCSPGMGVPGEGGKVFISPDCRGSIDDQGLLLRGIVLLGQRERSRCFSGALLDLALSSLEILTLGTRCLLLAAAWVIQVAGSVAWWCLLLPITTGFKPCSPWALPPVPQRCLVSFMDPECCLGP